MPFDRDDDDCLRCSVASTAGTLRVTTNVITSGTTIGLYGMNDLVWNAWTAASTSVTNLSPVGWGPHAQDMERIYNTWNHIENAVAQQMAQAEAHASQAHAYGVNASRRMARRGVAKKRLAKYKAEKLLLSVLCEEQRQDLKNFGFFKLYVQGKDGRRKIYRIRRGQVQNIELMEELPNGDLKPVKTLCAHPQILVPDADAMVAQKLMLETEEEKFLLIANHMAVRDRSLILASRAPTPPIFGTEPPHPVAMISGAEIQRMVGTRAQVRAAWASDQWTLRTIEARYNGICRSCGEPIRAGTQIRWAPQRGAFHMGCSGETQVASCVQVETPVPVTQPLLEGESEADRRMRELAA